MFHSALKEEVKFLKRVSQTQAAKISALEKELQNIEAWIDNFIESKTQEARDEKQRLEEIVASLQHLPENIISPVNWPQYDYSRLNAAKKKGTKITNDEAIKIKSAFSNGAWFSFGNGEFNDPNFDAEEVKRHADLLNEVIEKQIPKKPAIADEENSHLTMHYKCPACNEIFTRASAVSYCYHCGQALNWDDLI